MKKTIITILLVVLCLGIVGGGIAGIVKLTDTGKLDTKTIASTKFSVGGLDSNGKYMNTNASIYTKEAFECQGLEVSLDFDNEIEYQIYFYDQNNDFVHTTGKLSGAFVKDSVPFFAKYARIVVTPKNDDVVSNIEVLKYAKQLTIKVNREQGFKNFTENLIFKETPNSHLGNGIITTDAEQYPDTWVSNKVNVSSYKEGFIFAVSGDIGPVWLSVFGVSGEFLGQCPVDKCSSSSFVSSQGERYYFLDFKNLYSSDNTNLTPITDAVGYLQTNIKGNAIYELRCR